MNPWMINTLQEVTIPSGNIELNGLLYLPELTKAIVLFVHGSGSSRLSTRNQHVARQLNQTGLATLLFDLLTTQEEEIDNITRELRFDIAFLASRLIDVTRWCLTQPTLSSLNLGYFGASTGAGAALVAASKQKNLIKAVVSRGGRPDLAGDHLSQVDAPTLLIVGGNDHDVIKMNQAALSQLTCVKELAIVPGATHLFEEPGTLDAVALLAKKWFSKFLT